ncbi:MAG: glycerol-3-phosphate acyltransferase [Clostridiales bacterium]|nr:glycerol-3-phosphate acyltransferase [Clostridiales bacterium]
MERAIFYIVLGYLSGSVLFARLGERLFHRGGVIDASPDRNPGTFNAFQYGGFWCGVFTLCGDLFKGLIPVWLYVAGSGGLPWHDPWLSLVMAAPVLGHIFPVFYRFKGGKGIATTFGCLLGLLPEIRPVAIFAVFFLLFTLVLQITPHYHRTLVTYLCTLVAIYLMRGPTAVSAGFLLITGMVFVRLLTSQEEKEKMKVKVKLLWRR